MSVRWLWNMCARRQKALSLMAAGLLPEADRPALEAHLRKCPGCRIHLETTRRLSAQLTELGRALPAAAAPPELRGRWMKAVLEPGEPAPSALRISKTSERPSWLAGRKLAWGAAAACWMLSLLLRATAPNERPPGAPPPPISWQEVVLALERTRPIRGKPASAAEKPGHPAPAWPAGAPRSRGAAAAQAG